jgi:hypothetical protein
LWTHEFTNGFYSSPILFGKTLLLADIAGVLHFLKADKVFSEIRNMDFKERIVCTPAIADSTIYIRGESNLYCLGTQD